MFGMDRYNGTDFQVQDFVDDTGSSYTFLVEANDAADDYNNNMGYWIIDPEGIVAYYPGVHVLDIDEKQAVIEDLLLQLDAPERDVSTTPREFTLSKAYPNPFNDAMRVTVTLPSPGAVSVTVHDILGQQVAVLSDGRQPSGTVQLTWSPNGQAGGMYFIRAASPTFGQAVQRVVYLK